MKDEETTTDKYSKILETWGKYIGFLLAVGGLVNLVASNNFVALALLTIGCLLVSVWLWSIWRQGEDIKKAFIDGSPLPSVMYSEGQRKAAKNLFWFVLAIYIVALIFLAVKSFPPVPPTSTPTGSPTLTETATSIATFVFTPTFTDTPIFTPTFTPTPEIAFHTKQDCFDANKWTPYKYEGTSISTNAAGCWDLNSWGFTARDNGMIIAPPVPIKGIGHGIYIPIQNSASIKLNLNVKQFEINSINSANISIGIIDNKSPGLGNSRVIYYHYIPVVARDRIMIKTGENADYVSILTSTLPIGDTHEILIEIDGPLMTITVNQEKVEFTVPFSEKAFWIGYSIPDYGKLVATISNFEIR